MSKARMSKHLVPASVSLAAIFGWRWASVAGELSALRASLSTARALARAIDGDTVERRRRAAAPFPAGRWRANQ